MTSGISPDKQIFLADFSDSVAIAEPGGLVLRGRSRAETFWRPGRVLSRMTKESCTLLSEPMESRATSKKEGKVMSYRYPCTVSAALAAGGGRTGVGSIR